MVRGRNRSWKPQQEEIRVYCSSTITSVLSQFSWRSPVQWAKRRDPVLFTICKSLNTKHLLLQTLVVKAFILISLLFSVNQIHRLICWFLFWSEWHNTLRESWDFQKSSPFSLRHGNSSDLRNRFQKRSHILFIYLSALLFCWTYKLSIVTSFGSENVTNATHLLRSLSNILYWKYKIFPCSLAISDPVCIDFHCNDVTAYCQWCRLLRSDKLLRFRYSRDITALRTVGI